MILWLGLTVLASCELLGARATGPKEPITVSDLEQNAIFIEEETIFLQDGRIDIVIDLDIGDLSNRVAKTNHVVTTVFHNLTGIDEDLNKAVVALCRIDEQRMQRLVGLVTAHADQQGREPRFVVAAILAAAASGVAGLLWGRHEDHSTLLRLAEEQGHLIKVVQEEDHRLQELARHQARIQKVLLEEERLGRLRSRSYQGTMWLMNILELQNREITRMENLVQEVMGNKRTPATLWTPEAFARLARDLRQEAEKAGSVLPDITESAMVGTPLSYGTFSSRKRSQKSKKT